MAKVVEILGSKPHFDFAVKPIQKVADAYMGLRRTKLANISTERAYFFSGFLAKLEQSLIAYTTSFLRRRGFMPVYVPDILRPDVLEACGMLKPGDNNMVYFLDEKRHGKLALSGTSEMALGGFLRNKQFLKDQLPYRLTAVSRCFRAEISDIQEGIYRVHEFTKVEMFAACEPAASEAILQEFLSLQKEIMNSLELHAQVLDMPKEDLGLAAHRKFDIEAWMPGSNKYGEVTSSSNCTDFQSKRLNITYNPHNLHGNVEENISPNFVHTVNGTACAIPRLIIALLEQNQTFNGAVRLPFVLRKYFDGMEIVEKPKDTDKPLLRWRKKRSVSKDYFT